jgi:hypothetical protein
LLLNFGFASLLHTLVFIYNVYLSIKIVTFLSKLGVSLVLVFIARISSSEGDELIQNTVNLSSTNRFSYDKSFWLVFGSLVKQSKTL